MTTNNRVQYYLLTLPLALFAGMFTIHLIDAPVGGSSLRQVAYGWDSYEADMGRFPREKKKTQVLADFDLLGGLEQFPIVAGNTLPTVEPDGGFEGDGLRFAQNDTTEFGRVGADFKEILNNAIVQFDVRLDGPTGDFALFEGFASNPFDGTAVEPSHLALHVTTASDSYISSSPPVTDVFGDTVSGDLWNFSVNGGPNESLNLQVGTWYGLGMILNTIDPSLIDLYILSDGKEALIDSFPARDSRTDLGFVNLGTDESSAFGAVSFDDFGVAEVPEPSSMVLGLLALTGMLITRRSRTQR